MKFCLSHTYLEVCLNFQTCDFVYLFVPELWHSQGTCSRVLLSFLLLELAVSVVDGQYFQVFLCVQISCGNSTLVHCVTCHLCALQVMFSLDSLFFLFCQILRQLLQHFHKGLSHFFSLLLYVFLLLNFDTVFL